VSQLTPPDGPRNPVRAPLRVSQRALLMLTWAVVLASSAVWWSSKDSLISLTDSGYFSWRHRGDPSDLIFFTPSLLWPVFIIGGAVRITVCILRPSSFRWFDGLLVPMAAVGLFNQTFVSFIIAFGKGLAGGVR